MCRLIIQKKYELQQLNYNTDIYSWGLIQKNRLLNPINDAKFDHHPADDFSVVYRLIWGIYLDHDTMSDRETVLKNLADVQQFANGYVKVPVLY